jgi:hypothetical protein
MKNNILRIILILILALISAATLPVKKIQLTIVNKSGLPMEYKIEGKNDSSDIYYYLRVPEGDRNNPAEQIFTIYQGEYTMTAYYVELWDPVYGYACSSSSKTLYASRNIRLVFGECDQTPRNPGEPSMLKFDANWRYIY